jgi:FAD:protein FMN transferase
MPSTKSNNKPKPKHSFTFEAIGTFWTIDVEAAPAVIEPLRAAILERIESFDKTYSRFRDDSLVTQMSRQAGTYSLPPDAPPLLRAYREFYEVTGGAVTPLIGDVLVATGYDARYSLKPKHPRHPPAWEDVIAISGSTITLSRPAMLDFGAAGKGYLVDIITKVIQNHGIKSFCVDAGGDMRYQNAHGNLLRVGLEHPDNPSQVIGVVDLDNKSLCGSAGNRRAWAGYHHIISPHTLASPQHIKAVWVIAATALVADGLATCLFFVPPERLRQYNAAYVIMYADSSVSYSPGFPGTFFVS